MAYRSVRPILEDTYRITIQDLRAYGILKRGCTTCAVIRVDSKVPISIQISLDDIHEIGSIHFTYSRNGVPEHYQHGIEFFSCNIGGNRFFFLCNNCRARVTALYLVQGYFACRHCHGLVYRECREHGNPLELLHRSRDMKVRAKRLKENGHPRKALRMKRRAFAYEWRSHRNLEDYIRRICRRLSDNRVQAAPSHLSVEAKGIWKDLNDSWEPTRPRQRKSGYGRR